MTKPKKSSIINSEVLIYEKAQNRPPPEHYVRSLLEFWGNFKVGFTLAEVLITLGIIGVVAAITIPAIQAKYFEKVVVAKVKQTYSILGNAVNMMISEQGCGVSSCYNTVSAPDIETIAGWVDKYFKYTEKTCVPANGSKKAISWLPEFGYTLDGQKTNNPVHSVAYNFGNHLNSNVCFYKLNNGVNLAITRHNTFDPNGGSVLYFVMDANGKQGPNRVGKDVFVFTSSSSSYSSSRNHALSGEFALHAWSSASMAGGMCYTTWTYIKKKCPLDEKTPTLYVLTYGKLPNLTP